MADWSDLGLLDNPFEPTEFRGVENVTLLQDLVTAPLQVHVEPNLKPLYCLDLGPFSGHLRKFQNDLRLKGYRQQPPQSGRLSFVFTICGPKGSGKSSLANMMIDWLKGCLSPGEGPWDVEERFRDDPGSSAEEQGRVIGDLQSDIEKKQVKYHCIVLDNLINGADRAAFVMWTGLRKTRQVVMFLIADDLPILRSGFSGINMRPYVTTALSADDGVRFVKHRMSCFRAKHFPWLEQFPLFPFSESDIREMLTPRHSGEEIVTLRQFSVYLSEALKMFLLGLGPFDPGGASAQQVESMLIDLETAVASLAREV